MNNHSKISIITVCYNAEKDIEKTILSVVNQTYDNLEYIVIDGGSSDGTLSIITRYAHKIDKIISEPDNGIYDAMNKGVSFATGDWINFMNAGDSFYSIDVLNQIFLDNCLNYDIIYGDRISVFNFGKYRHIPSSLDEFKNDFPFFHQSAFVKSFLIKRRNFDLKYQICADFESFFYLWEHKCKFKYINIIISCCECEDGYSSKMSNQIERIKENLKITSTPYYTIRAINSFIKTIVRVILLSFLKTFNSHLYYILYEYRCSTNKRMEKI